MVLFLISFLMVFLSSFLLASIFASRKYLTGVIYTLLIAFAQIILTIETLSLFKAISTIGILILNFIILSISIWYWIKKEKPIYKPQIKRFLAQIVSAIKKDKMLAVMAVGLIVFVCVTIFLCFFCPIMSYDGLGYHLNRALVWASQGSLAHFDVADDRNINMAINTELLYTWFFSFIPKNMLLGFFAFAGYLLALSSLYSFMELCGFCMRKRLWTVFLFSSIAGVVTEASGSETDIIIGGLVLASLALFMQGAKKNSLIPIYFSSLAVSIAVGAKTSAFFVVPALALSFICILLKYQRERFWKYSAIFFLCSFINVFIFSAYNYILNFMEFGHFIGSTETRTWHGASGGIKGYISGLIRHSVLLIDFAGFKYSLFIQKYLFEVQNKLLTLLNIPLDLNVIYTNQDRLNNTLNDSRMGGGVIGTLVLLPCAIIAIIKGVFCGKKFKNRLLAISGLGLFLSVAVMSACIGFMLFSSRFTITFLMLASPVLVLSYIKSNKNLIKYIILFWVMSYLVVISTHIWSRHFVATTGEILKGKTAREIRTNQFCSLSYKYTGKMHFCNLRSLLYSCPKGSRIGLFAHMGENIATIKFMESDGYFVDYLLLENLHKYDIKKYDYLVFTDEKLLSSYIRNPYEIMDNYYVKNGKLRFVDSNKAGCILVNEDEKKTLITKDEYASRKDRKSVCFLPYEILYKNGFVERANLMYGEMDDETQEAEEGLTTIHIFKNKNN